MGNKRVNLLNAAAAALILILLPALSWYYLRKGADWRRAGLADMATKQAITRADIKLLTTEGDTLQLREGTFALATNIEATTSQIKATLNKVAEQFDHQENLLFLYFGSATDDLAKEWAAIDCQKSDCGPMIKQLFTDNSNTALIDDSLNIRATYDITSVEQTRKLAEHGAILFPVEKRKKIELKRGVDK